MINWLLRQAQLLSLGFSNQLLKLRADNALTQTGPSTVFKRVLKLNLSVLWSRCPNKGSTKSFESSE
eukprot:g17166.t1